MLCFSKCIPTKKTIVLCFPIILASITHGYTLSPIIMEVETNIGGTHVPFHDFGRKGNIYIYIYIYIYNNICIYIYIHQLLQPLVSSQIQKGGRNSRPASKAMECCVDASTYGICFVGQYPHVTRRFLCFCFSSP